MTLYLALAFSGTGMLIQTILLIINNRQVKDSNSVGTARTAWVKRIRTKFDAYMLRCEMMNNTEAFIERQIKHRKLLGISYRSWENISAMCAMLCVVDAFPGMLTGNVKLMIMPLLLAIITAIYIRLSDLPGKCDLILVNLSDYFSNSFMKQMLLNEAATVEKELNNCEKFMDGDAKEPKQARRSERNAHIPENEEKPKNNTEVMQDVVSEMDDESRKKHDDLKKRAEIPPEDEDKVIAEVLREFLT